MKKIKFAFVYAVFLMIISLGNILAQSEKPQSRSSDENTTKKESKKELQWLNGTWTGQGYQQDASTQSTWKINFTFNNTTNEMLIEYPSFPCSGYWKLQKSDSRQATFIENITQGKTLCQDQGTIIITKIDDTFVSYVYFLPQFQKGVVAFSVLERKNK